jgi:hypothetical protein
MADAFISYQRCDAVVVTALAEDIRSLGHTVWLDHELSGGQRWWDEILHRIRNCDIFILALSRTFLKSTACGLETDYAARLGKTILPVLVVDDISHSDYPPALAAVQVIPYHATEKNDVIRLARSLSMATPSPMLLEDLPIPPGAPPISTIIDYDEQCFPIRGGGILSLLFAGPEIGSARLQVPRKVSIGGDLVVDVSISLKYSSRVKTVDIEVQSREDAKCHYREGEDDKIATATEVLFATQISLGTEILLGEGEDFHATAHLLLPRASLPTLKGRNFSVSWRARLVLTGVQSVVGPENSRTAISQILSPYSTGSAERFETVYMPFSVGPEE